MTKKSRSGRGGRRQAAGSNDGAYDVGYGKPPKHTQFGKGQSGNPRGRGKGQRSLRSIVVETLDEKIWIREGEVRRKVSKKEALVRATVGRAIAGDQKANAMLMALFRLTNLVSEQPEATSVDALTREDEMLLADFLDRRGPPPSKSPKGNSE